ncbi:MAG: hypothetical protein EBX69_03205 [Betaproteobacteria bacterium]|nr:hypothetical protein [Betaproteobacteria bacterium]
MDETELAGKYMLRDSYRNQFVKGDELGIGGAEIFSARIVAIIDRDARGGSLSTKATKHALERSRS